VRRSNAPFIVRRVIQHATKEDHMAVTTTTERSTGATAVRPFSIEIAEAELEALRARVAATRWPDKETVVDHSQGVQLATIQALARYWSTD
jgi:Epoxide hydrolase N terminus